MGWGISSIPYIRKEEIMATKKETAEIMEVSNPYNEEMVVIELYKDSERYKDDLFVGRNGMTYLIKRGVPVKVPKGIAEIIENQIKMDNLAADKIEEAKAKAAKA